MERKETTLRTLRFVTCGLALLLVPLLAGGVRADMKSGGHKMVAPGELNWADSPSLPPGSKIAVIEGNLKEAVPFTFRIKFPADAKVAVHTHPVTERVTVVSGAFHLGIGDKFEPSKATALKPGSVAIMEPGVSMFAFTKEETVIQLHGVGPWGIHYLNPADDPAKK
jgi:quercetin dioxygenase-like cupin family protein